MDAVLERPFYFVVVLWGERFREYFLRYCVPSLLAPGNLPAISTGTPSKFLIATRPEDWAELRVSPIFELLGRFVEPFYIEIPPCPPEHSGCQHMGIGHRIALEMAHRDKAYAVVVTPDSMLSEGSVGRLQALAQDGVELVLTAALRFGEEPFLGHLRDLGALPDANLGAVAAPVVITGRQMVHAAVNGFHSETLAYEWDAPGLLAVIPAAWWRVPGEDGIVLHSLSWAPLLLDYGSIADHDTSTFDQWTLDGDYLFNNSKAINRFHVVQDSDEIFLASWGPLNERPKVKTRFPFDGRLAGHFFRQSFYSGFFDPLKRNLFFKTVRWHAKPLNAQWNSVEQRALTELRRWVKPPSEAGVDSSNSAKVWGISALISAVRSLIYVWIYRKRIRQYSARLLRGDRETLRRIAWFVRTFMFGTGHSSSDTGK